MHARNHRPKGWYGPNDPGGSDPLPWWGLGGDAARPAYSGVVQSITSLRGYWRLGDGDEPYLDTSGYDTVNPADLEIVGSGSAMDRDVTPGVLPPLHDDGCVRFHGGEYLRAHGDSIGRFDFPGRPPYTATAWVRRNSTGGGDGPFLGQTGSFTSGHLNGWHLEITSGGAPKYSRHKSNAPGAPGSEQQLTAGFAIPTGQWAFIAGVYDGTDMSLWVDGAKVAEQPSDHSHVNWNNKLFVGSASDVSMDEAAIFHAALTAGQLQELYATGRPSSLVPTVFGPYTIPAEVGMIGADGTFTITLPAAADRAGSTHTVKNVGTGTITVSAAGSDPVDGTGAPGTVVLGSLDAVTLTSVGYGWWITGGYGI
jgi:hypothetical protein